MADFASNYVGDAASLQAAFDAKWQEWRNDPTATFRVDGSGGVPAKDKTRATFDVLAEDYEDALHDSLTGAGITHLSGDGGNYSRERLALISLQYNGGGDVIGDSLLDALAAGDRALVWATIRYFRTPAGENDIPGLAKRRYVEAELFGLYNEGESPASLTEAQQRALYETIATSGYSGPSYPARLATDEGWLAHIIDEEFKFGIGGSKPAASGHDALTLARMVAAKLNAQLSFTLEEIPTLGHALSPASDWLLQELADGGRVDPSQFPTFSSGFDGELQFATTRTSTEGGVTYRLFRPDEDGTTANRDLLVGYRDEANDLRGLAGDDVLIGGERADRLDGGTGADTLAGGEGADPLSGGAGFDTYIAGHGDVISDSDDLGRVLFDGEILHGGVADTNGVIRSEDGRFTYSLDGTTLSVAVEGGTDTLTIENYNNRDLGIFLAEKPGAPLRPIAGGEAHDSLLVHDQIVIRDDGQLDQEPYVLTAGVFPPGSEEFSDADSVVDAVSTALEGPPDAMVGGEGWDSLLINNPHQPYDIQMYGEAGNDTLNSQDGADWLDGGEDHDGLIAGSGDDTLIGGTGDDVLSGNRGEDILIGGARGGSAATEAISDNHWLLGGEVCVLAGRRQPREAIRGTPAISACA